MKSLLTAGLHLTMYIVYLQVQYQIVDGHRKPERFFYGRIDVWISK